MSKPVLLVGDIGGTNARFALADPDGQGFHDPQTLQCAAFGDPVAAIRHFLETVGVARPEAICLAAAGPVIGDRVRVTNNHWTIAAGTIRTELRAERVQLLNDFEAIAWSIPCLGEEHLETVGQVSHRPLPEDAFSVVTIRPGTGLGTGGLCKRGGHIGFAPKSKVQMDILAVLREKFDRVSAERLVSGAGIENIYWALNALQGERRKQLSAAEIFAAAAAGTDVEAADATQLFYELLGQVAGDIDRAYLLHIPGSFARLTPPAAHVAEGQA